MNVAGPFVIGGVYNVALIVDGKTVETKPLRVNDDPEVVLTSVERKRMFDQAMEIHALQPRVTEASAAHASLTRQISDLTTAIGARSDIAADVKASVDAFSKELAALAPKLTTPQGRGGGGGRGGAPRAWSPISPAKKGMTAMRWATRRARYTRSRRRPPGDRRPERRDCKATTSARRWRPHLTLTVPARCRTRPPGGQAASSGAER